MKKTLSVLLAVALLLSGIIAGPATASAAAPTFNPGGFVANGVSLPDVGLAYRLITNHSAATDYLVSFADPVLSEPCQSLVPVYLNATTDQITELTAYYNARVSLPVVFRDYLIGALTKVNPFAYIDTTTTVPTLIDAAKHDIIASNVPMTIPGDYPSGIYAITATFTDVDESLSSTVAWRLGINSFSIHIDCGSGGTITPADITDVDYGANISFTIAPATGYHIASVSADEFSLGTVSSFAFTNVNSDHTLAATFAAELFNVTPSVVGAGGTITPNTVQSVVYGTNTTFQLTPAAGYHLATLTVDGMAVAVASSYTFTNVTAVHSIAATFAVNTPVTYAVTIATLGGGTASPTGTTTVTAGTAFFSVITPLSGYSISSIYDNGVYVAPTAIYYLPVVSANHYVVITFVQNGYSISGTTSGGNGIVTPASQIIPLGGTATFTLVPSSGYKVATITDNGIAKTATTIYTIYNVTEPHYVVATFAAETYTITPIVGEHGFIFPSGVTTVSHGGSVAMTVTPAVGYLIDNVLIDGTEMSIFSRERYGYTFTNIVANHTITASFREVPDKIVPVVVILNPALNASECTTIRTSEYDLDLTATDNKDIARIVITSNGNTLVDALRSSGTMTFHLLLPQGSNAINVIAYDTSLNTTTVKACITVDSVAPVVTLKKDIPATTTETSLRIDGTVTDAISGPVSVIINGFTTLLNSDGSFSATVANLHDGINFIAISSADKAGNTYEHQYSIQRQTPPPANPPSKIIVFTIDKKIMVVNGFPIAIDVAPLVHNSRTLVPFRVLVDSLGGTVSWNAKTQLITVKIKTKTIEMWIGRNKAKVNGNSVAIDSSDSKVVPEILSSCTYIPLRFLTEQLGMLVTWNSSTKTITIIAP